MLVQGREVDLIGYYPCHYCGGGRGFQMQLTWEPGDPHMPGLLGSDGVMEFTEERRGAPLDLLDTDVVLLREVGRQHCRTEPYAGPIDHVYYQWRWRPA